MTPDLYIEEIAVRAGLEGARRDHFVPRLRTQLDELIGKHQTAGLSTTEAEVAAMHEMGSPASVARGLGSRTSYPWSILEAAAMGVLIYFIAVISIGRLYIVVGLAPRYVVPVAVVIAIVCLSKYFWPRIRVDAEGIHYYKPLRPKHTIPFTDISSVKMERGRILGEHRIQIHYGSKNHAVLTSKDRYFRFVAAGLEAYVPQAMDDKVKQFLKKLRLTPAAMPTWQKLALTLGCLLSLILILITAKILWFGAGLTLAFAVGILLAVITVGSGISLARGRVKRLLFALLTIAFFWLLQLLSASVVVDIDYRALLWLAVAAMPLAVLIIWWPTRNRAVQFAVTVIWLGAIYGAAYADYIPEDIEGQTKSLGTADLVVENSVWLKPDNSDSVPAIFCFGSVYSNTKTDNGNTKNCTSSGFAIFNNGKTIDQNLPPGRWDIWGRITTGSVLLSHSPNDGKSTESLIQFYTVDTTGKLEPDTTVYNVWDASPMITTAHALISPNGNFVAASKKDMSLVIVDRDNQTTRAYPNLQSNGAWKWRNDHTLELLKRDKSEPKQQATGHIEKWLLDVATGVTTQTGALNIGAGWALYGAAPSTQFALIFSDTAFGIVNLADGTSTTLPRYIEKSPIDWNTDLNQVAYITAESGTPELIIASPEGIIARRDVAADKEFARTKLSPDGSKVLLYSQSTRKWMLPVGIISVSDVKADTVKIVGREPWVYNVLAFIASPTNPRIDNVLWTPDSKRIAWPSGRAFYSPSRTGIELELITPGK